MAFEFGNQPTPSRMSTKRRLNDDNDGYEVKRVYDNDALRRSACDPTAAAPPQSQLPSITYASPDYRPPPPRQDETPLWLQPPPAPPTMLMDEDLETDEDDSHSLPTPSASSLLEHNKTTSERVFAPLPGQQHMHYRN